MIRVVVIGAKGKMGRIAVEAVEKMDGYQVVGKVHSGDDLDAMLKEVRPDIAIELSGSESVKKNSWTIVNNSVRPVIGSSGLKQKDVEELQVFCTTNSIGGIMAPNFSIGMALSKKMISELSPFFKDISIVEFHHAQKQDKPSGTARDMAEAINLDESLIASVRSNGFIAKQQVYLARSGERILIDHETFNRKDSFEEGIQLCCEKVMDLSQLVIGLEKIIRT